MSGKARYLIAADAGLGKTLSLVAAMLVLSLLDDKTVNQRSNVFVQLLVSGLPRRAL